MFGEKVSECHAFIVGPYLHVKAIVAFILAAKVHCGRVEAVVYGGPFAVEGRPCTVDGRMDCHAVDCKKIHPALRLCEGAFAQGHLPHPIINFESGTGWQYGSLTIDSYAIGQFFAVFFEMYGFSPVG